MVECYVKRFYCVTKECRRIYLNEFPRFFVCHKIFGTTLLNLLHELIERNATRWWATFSYNEILFHSKLWYEKPSYWITEINTIVRHALAINAKALRPPSLIALGGHQPLHIKTNSHVLYDEYYISGRLICNAIRYTSWQHVVVDVLCIYYFTWLRRRWRPGETRVPPHLAAHGVDGVVALYDPEFPRRIYWCGKARLEVKGWFWMGVGGSGATPPCVVGMCANFGYFVPVLLFALLECSKSMFEFRSDRNSEFVICVRSWMLAFWLKEPGFVESCKYLIIKSNRRLKFYRDCN